MSPSSQQKERGQAVSYRESAGRELVHPIARLANVHSCPFRTIHKTASKTQHGQEEVMSTRKLFFIGNEVLFEFTALANEIIEGPIHSLQPVPLPKTMYV